MSQEARAIAISKTGLSVCMTLFVFALVLALNPLPFATPVTDRAVIPAWATDTTPVRQPKLTPEYRSGVFTYSCSDCHKILPPWAQATVRTAVQHQEIVLDHGINTWCLSCHHPENRDAFVDDRGGEIPWDQPQRLCRKCHGPVFRDWQNGAHGRTNGYWNKAQGEQSRRKCIECHDPHQPPFPAMHPAPGPSTLRMGPQDGAGHGEATNPLQVRDRSAADDLQVIGAKEGH
jgi:hypothetical protein